MDVLGLVWNEVKVRVAARHVFGIVKAKECIMSMQVPDVWYRNKNIYAC